MPSKILDSAIELNKIQYIAGNNTLNFTATPITGGSPIVDATAGIYANAAFVKANAAFSSANSVNVYGANTQSSSFFSLPIGNTSQRPASPTFGAARYNTDINGLEVYSPNGWTPLAAPPTISTVSPSSFNGESGTNFEIQGTNFTSDAQVYFVTANGSTLLGSTIIYFSSSQINATTPRAIKVEEEPISVRVVQQSGTVTKSNCIDAGGLPTWITSAGNLGSIFGANTVNVYLSATDPEGSNITYQLSSGSLPTGLNLNSANGLIQGVATAVTANTTYNFVIKANDTVNNNTDRSFSYTILNRAPVINTASGSLGTIYSGNAVPTTTISAYDPDGGTITYSIASGSLPANTGLGSANGVIQGTPVVVTSNTTYTINLIVTDQGSCTASNTYTFTVLNRPPIINTVAGVVGTIVSGNVIPSVTISAYDPDGGAVTYSNASGNIVNAYIGSSNGIITGTSAVTVTSNTTYTMGVRVTDVGGDYTDRNYSFVVLNRPPIINTASAILATVPSNGPLPANTIQAYDPDGGAITYSITSGNASSWTTIDSSTGVIGGTATTGTVGSNVTYTFTVTATDPGGLTATRDYSWIVQQPLPTWTTASNLGVGYTGAAYSFTVAATESTSYSLISGSLPPGYSFNASTGVISGTISTAISDYSYLDYSFTIRASNSVGNTDRTFSLRMWSKYREKSCFELGEGGTLNATAPTDENGRLMVWNRKLFSAYGTPTGSCPNYSNGGCNSPSSNSWSPTLGTITITQTFGNGEFGDPCGGTEKRSRIVLVWGPSL